MKPITPLSNNLKQLMARDGLTTASLARLTGIGQPVIYRLISTETENPKLATLIPIAQHFGISISQLIGDEQLPSNSSKHNRIPILSWENAINWPEINKDLLTDFITTTEPVSKNAYALITKDTTMQPKFPENTILIIDRDAVPQNKDYVIVWLADQNQATFKQLLFDGAKQYLKPLNPDFTVTPIDTPCRFLGVVAEARMRF